MATSNVPFVKGLYAKFAEKDIPGFLNGLAPDIKWTVADGFPYAGTYDGSEAVLEGVVKVVPKDWDGFRHELHSWVDCGSEVLAVGRYHGTWKATGRSMKAPFVHVWTVENGACTRFRQYVDGPATAVATDGFRHPRP